MKTKQFKKNIAKILLITSIVACSNLVKADVSVKAMSSNHETRIEPCADEIRYRYKIIDGKVYRRLFNYSKNEWIGQWELCK